MVKYSNICLINRVIWCLYTSSNSILYLINILYSYEHKVLKVKVAQSCPTLCDPMDYTVHGILQARTLEWVAFPFSRDLPNPGIEPRSPTLQADSWPTEPRGKPYKHKTCSKRLYSKRNMWVLDHHAFNASSILNLYI